MSLFLGFLALLQILKGKVQNFENAVYLITGSVILDGFDGTVARLTKTESNFGVQLDSLVDAVTFGLVTGVMTYVWGFQSMSIPVGKVIGFVFLSAGVIRLARFNVLKEADVMPSNIFVGLPIPLGALSIASVVLLVREPLVDKLHVALFSLFVILVAFLMVSSVKYRTMKKIKSKNNVLILLSLVIVMAVALNFPRETIPALTFLYLISPIFFWILGKFGKNKAYAGMMPHAATPTVQAANPTNNTAPDKPAQPENQNNQDNPAGNAKDGNS